ncbi:50S ribosomal protein L23 [Patescibacteria group bacterium]
MNTHTTIIEPITTEKSTMLSDKAKYVFRVASNATKVDVKKAIKAIYDADVDKVNMTYIQPKTRVMRGRNVIVKRRKTKKAVVTIKDGKTIDITKFKDSKSKKKK